MTGVSSARALQQSTALPDPAHLRRRLQSALEDGDLAYVREVLADPSAALSDEERASYGRLFRFSARLRPAEPADPRDAAAIEALRPRAVAGWVAVHEGNEIARGPVLQDVLAQARAMGIAAPRVMWLPAAEARDDDADQA